MYYGSVWYKRNEKLKEFTSLDTYGVRQEAVHEIMV